MNFVTAPTTVCLPRRQTRTASCNFVIVWLDTDSSNETITSVQRLHDVQDNLRTFSDCDRCVDFLTDVEDDDRKVLLVIASSLAEYIVPTLHELSQIDSIYVFGSNDRLKDQQLFTNWSKVKGTYTDVTSVFAKLRRRIRMSVARNDDWSEFTTLSSADVASDKNNDKQHQEATFMYSRLLYIIFSEMEVTEDEREEFIYMCRTENANNLTWINEFKREYDVHRAIWWYTRATYLYSILNQGFRTQNIHVLIAMKFFVRDLYLRLNELHSKASLPNTITVYRGQSMQHADFDRQLKNNIGGLLSISTFWSTSRTLNVADMFLERDPDKVSIIFEMNVDTTIEIDKCPFADIHEESAIRDEDEVLFSVGTVFRIVQIVHIDNDDIWKVSLTMTTDADEKLHLLTNQMIDEISGSTGYHRLGKLMCIMGKWEEALEVYETLLDQTPDDDCQQLSYIYHQLGYVCDKRAALTQALDYYQQSLKYRSSDELKVATVYNNMGIIYYQRNDFNRALEHFQRSLDIEIRSPSPNQHNIAIRLSNIGGILKEQGKLKEALANFERALDIQRAHLAPIHPHLAIMYNNIGTIHFAMKNYSAALAYQQKTLDIQRLSLPPNHPTLAPVHCNIASTLEDLDRYDEAVQHVRQAIDILLHTFEPDHPDVLGIQRGLEKMLRRREARSIK